MRTDKFMMAKAWMKQDQAPQSEARDTWNMMEAEFNDERKATLMASAKSDKIKAMMNEQYGPGTIKYGSEIPQPEVKTPQAAFEFSQRNPAADGGRMGFDAGGMAKLVSYVESLPKGTTVTTKMLEDYVKKNKINVNIKNFFDRKAPSIKGYTFDTSFQGSKLTDVEKTNIEKFSKAKYDKSSIGDQFRVRRGDDVGKLAPEKQAKQVYKKEYDKAYKFYKDKGLEIDFAAEENIRQNISKNNGKFVTPTKKLKAEPGLSSIFKNYTKVDLIKDLKKGKDLGEISIEYFDKNEKEILKILEGKRDYTKPLGRLSTDLGAAIRQDEEAIKLYDKIKKKNTFKQLSIKKKYVRELETLLPFAQEQGLVPKVNSKGVKIDTASKYFQHAYKVKRDPIAKLFGFYEKVGIEHPGGVARALIFDDPATLNEIVATMPDTNTISGRTYDSYATGQARFFEKTGDAKYIKSINKIILNKQKEFGKPRTILDVDGDTVTRRKTPFSLTDPNLIEDSKSFINEYVSQGGSKRKNFNKLDESLQKSILAFEEGNKIEGNKFLKTALKDTGAEDSLIKAISVIACPVKGAKKAEGGRIGLKDGLSATQCFDDSVKMINNGMKGASPAALRNLAKLGPMLLKAGSAVMSGLIVPEALIVGLETAARVGLGDTPSEAILRATDYLTPDSFFGDFMQKADLMKLERTLGKDVANIAAQSFDRTNQSDKVNKLEEKLKNLEAMTESGDFGYVGDLTNQINMTKDQIKQEKNKLKNTTQIGQEGRDIFTERALEDSYDASMAKSKFAASQLVDSQSENPRISAEQAMQDMKSQEQLNKKQLPQRMLKGSAGEQAFLKLSQLPKGPRQGSEIDDLVTASNANFIASNFDRRVDSSLLKYVQDLKQKEKDMSIADMVNVYGAESILGTQGNMGQPVERTGPGYMTNYKPLNRFGSQQRPVLYPKGRGQLAEGGITGLRSKYEYKK